MTLFEIRGKGSRVEGGRSSPLEGTLPDAESLDS